MSNPDLWALVLFLLTLLAGYWLFRTGTPYRSGIFNLHKLLALAAAVLSIFWLSGLVKAGSNVPWFYLGAAIFLVVIFFASGAMLSIGKPNHPAVLLSHRIAVFLSVVLAGVLIYTFVL